jgi:hypothetical protein
LHLQQGDGLGMVIDDALHQRLAQSCLHGSVTLHCWRQLAVVTGQDDARHAGSGTLRERRARDEAAHAVADERHVVAAVSRDTVRE